jgi:putative redox protein
MKAIARRTAPDTFTHELSMGDHRVIADEPRKQGGHDRGPNPQELLGASLAACVAITVEMYAQVKRWDVGLVEVECEYSQADKDSPTSFDLILRLPDHLTPEQAERLRIIAGKCPVHRTLAGPVTFSERVELVPAD